MAINKNKQELLIEWLFIFSALTLPFTKALTLDFRFPIKIYEITLSTAFLCLLFNAPLRKSIFQGDRLFNFILASFISYLIFNSGIQILGPSNGLSSTLQSSRFGIREDMIAKTMYLILDVFGLILFAYYFKKDQMKYTKFWLWGGFLASLYAWYLFLCSWAQIHPFTLPGIYRNQIMSVGGHEFIRSGTFEEGNFFGFYLLLTTIFALNKKLYRAALFFSLTSLITFSTINILVIGLFWIAHLASIFLKLKQRNKWLFSVFFLLLIGFCSVKISESIFFKTIFVEKLSGESYSRRDRMEQIKTGWNIFKGNPYFGVGLSQYAYYYHAYKPLDEFDVIHAGRKLIPNNIFIELLSETGIIGFSLFVLILIQLYRKCQSENMQEIKTGLLFVMLSMNAFPSISAMYIWGFFGAIVGISEKNKTAGSRSLGS